ncbi:hypothetical protein ACJZ2D_013617 [Fusarium nematophilum]
MASPLPQMAPLAPRPMSKPRSPTRDKPTLPIHHSDREWAAVYPHIERMYVHERRKLRYVMDTMEDKYNFKATVIVELLKRRQGILAGRLARKAFLDVEPILQVEGPLFIWNVLEILHGMASLGESQLFRMLLLHLVSLARSHFTAQTHPVLQMLLNLQRLVDTWGFQDSLQVGALEQGWALNADVVFTRFDPRLLVMYYRLVWDSGLVRVPQERLREADRWFSVLEDKVAAGGEAVEASAHPDLEAAGEGHPPRDYEALKNTSLAAIQHRSTLDLREPSTKVRVLSGLLKSRILEDDAKTNPPQVSRLRARVVAYLMKILVEVDQEMGFEPEIAIERMRSIIALRDYGQKQTGPQIVHELWLLEDLLLREGRKREAAEVRKDAFRRLEGYLDDVPVHEI